MFCSVLEGDEHGGVWGTDSLNQGMLELLGFKTGRSLSLPLPGGLQHLPSAPQVAVYAERPPVSLKSTGCHTIYLVRRSKRK